MNGLRRLRERKFMTQAQLAAALGLRRQATISSWESGEDRPRLENMRKLCEVLNVSPDELLSALDTEEGKTIQ